MPEPEAGLPSPAAESAAPASDALPSGEPTDDATAVENGADADSAEPASTPGDDSPEEADDDEGDQPEQTEEERKLSRRERQRVREEERIARAVEERLAKVESDRKAAEAAQAAQKAAEEIQQASRAALMDFLGSDEDYAEALRVSRIKPSNPDFDYDKHEDALTRLEGWDRARKMTDQIRDLTWLSLKGEVAALGSKHLTDAASKAAFGKVQDVTQAVEVLLADREAGLKASHAAEVKTLKDAHAAELKRLTTDRDGWRTKAGGAGPEPTAGGSVSGTHVFTRAELATMDTATYRRNRQEIERQAAAGLIR